jgi:cytidylate kinase
MTVVALDGPAGAGKSTVAKSVAEALGYRYLDTGAMYRALALAALDRGLPLDDEVALATLADAIDIDLDGTEVKLDGSDVSDRIRERDVTAAVSTVSSHPSVRSALVERQRALAEGQDVVVEGRDIGTTVFPRAEVKVFLTASLDERARRRCEQDGSPDDAATIERVKAAIAARDAADSDRASSPLRRAEDAVELDTTDRALEDVVAEIVGLVSSRTS